MSEIKVDNISKSFGNTCVLKDISFQVKDGHLLSLLGPSGCGKTTLLRIIAGLEYADEGNIFVGEKNLTPIPVEKRNIGVVFQNYALIPHMTVYNNIAYGLKIRKVPKDKIREQVSISEDPSENAAECIIKNIIFTGEICRLRVDLCGLELTLSCINIQAENLRAGQKIYFRTNPQMTHYYKMVKTGEEN